MLLWLVSTVSDELLSGVVYATSAFVVWVDLKEQFVVWEDLKEQFDKVNRMMIYQLHRKITTLSQGTDFVMT